MARERRNLFPDDIMPAVPGELQGATDGEVKKSAKPARGESTLTKTSLYLKPAVHDKLKEIAFHERKKVHDLVNEGLDLVLKDRHYPTAHEIAAKAKRS